MGIYQTKPYALENGEGQSLHSVGTLVTIKATSVQSGGAFNLFEVECPPGYETPLHIPYVEDVAVYVLDGTLTFFWGSETRAAAPGSFFFQPRGTPQGFRVTGATPARILVMTLPAGIDQFVVEQGQQPSEAEWMAAAARYKIETLGLLPG